MNYDDELQPNAGITLILYGSLWRILPLIVPIMWKSEVVSRGRSSVDDIIKFLYTGQMNLWAIFDKDTDDIFGYVITEIKEYPQCKMLVLQYLAGDQGLIEAAGDVVYGTLEKFARDAGCNGIESYGRPGWGPYAKRYGLTVQTVVYEKYFREE